MTTKNIPPSNLPKYVFSATPLARTFVKTMESFMNMCKSHIMEDYMGAEEWVFTNVFYIELLRLYRIISKYNNDYLVGWIVGEFYDITKGIKDEDFKKMAYGNLPAAMADVSGINFYLDWNMIANYMDGGIRANDMEKLSQDDYDKRVVETRKQITDSLFKGGLAYLRKLYEYYNGIKDLAAKCGKCWDDSLLSSFVVGTEDAEKIWSAIMLMPNDELERFHDDVYLPKTEEDRIKRTSDQNGLTNERLDEIHSKTWNYLKKLKKI